MLVLTLIDFESYIHNENELNNRTEWMTVADKQSKGFSWKSGVNRDTTGIILCFDVFLHTNKIGEKLAIVLMDTQGLFDHETSLIIQRFLR